MYASFRFKLALSFALLALVPLATAFIGYRSLAERSEARRADARLEAGLRGVAVAYNARLNAVGAAAETLASQPAVQRALRSRDRATLARALARVPHAAVVGPRIVVGTLPRHAARRTVTIREAGRTLGRVVVSIPLDRALLQTLSAALLPGDALLAERTRVASAVPAGVPTRVVRGSRTYRALASEPIASAGGLAFVVLTPQTAIDSAVRASEVRLGGLVLGSLLVFFVVAAWLLGRSLVLPLRSLTEAARAIARGDLRRRVPVRGRDELAELSESFNRMAAELEQRLGELEAERERLREATARFGEALAATHDPEHLLQVVVESAVEATGATGGVVVSSGGEVARAGNPSGGKRPYVFPLRAGAEDFGSLLLTADELGIEQLETATALVADAVVALENARRHRVAEQHALVDSLTGLANRRRLDETLQAELARAVRQGGSLCLVLCDLDRFKNVNDRFGHQFGDRVLVSFARTLESRIRGSDVAGRWGGEEFALVLPATELAGGIELAERIRVATEAAPVTHDGGAVRVTASFGVAAVAPGTAALEELVRAADEALYRAKREGRNRVAAAPEPGAEAPISVVKR